MFSCWLDRTGSSSEGDATRSQASTAKPKTHCSSSFANDALDFLRGRPHPGRCQNLHAEGCYQSLSIGKLLPRNHRLRLHAPLARFSAIARFKKQPSSMPPARLAQSAERKALNLVVVGSSPTVGALYLRDAVFPRSADMVLSPTLLDVAQKPACFVKTPRPGIEPGSSA